MVRVEVKFGSSSGTIAASSSGYRPAVTPNDVRTSEDQSTVGLMVVKLETVVMLVSVPFKSSLTWPPELSSSFPLGFGAVVDVSLRKGGRTPVPSSPPLPSGEDAEADAEDPLARKANDTDTATSTTASRARTADTSSTTCNQRGARLIQSGAHPQHHRALGLPADAGSSSSPAPAPATPASTVTGPCRIRRETFRLAAVTAPSLLSSSTKLIDPMILSLLPYGPKYWLEVAGDGVYPDAPPPVGGGDDSDDKFPPPTDRC
jgi:hypothetical protein